MDTRYILASQIYQAGSAANSKGRSTELQDLIEIYLHHDKKRHFNPTPELENLIKCYPEENNNLQNKPQNNQMIQNDTSTSIIG